MMASELEHPDDAIQLLLDGRLDPSEVAGVEAHLAACESCRRRSELLASTRRITASLDRPPLPPGLETRLRATLREEEGASRARAGRRFAIAAIGFAVVAAAIALVVMRPRTGGDDLVSAAARGFEEVRAGRSTVELATADPSRLSAFFESRGVPKAVYDLASAPFALEGGRVDRLGTIPAAFSIYRGPAGDRLVCQMYRGRVSDLPAGGRLQVRDGVRLHLHERDGVSLVFWQEGPVVCVLVAQLPPERLLDLAASKASKT